MLRVGRRDSTTSLRAHVRAALGAGLRPALPRRGLETLVEPALEVRKLTLELLVARPARERERAVVERRLHRATRLRPVGAVGEAALRGELFHVGERLGDAVRRLPELQLPHPRGVEDETATGKQDELAVRGRVASLAEIG